VVASHDDGVLSRLCAFGSPAEPAWLSALEDPGCLPSACGVHGGEPDAVAVLSSATCVHSYVSSPCGPSFDGTQTLVLVSCGRSCCSIFSREKKVTLPHSTFAKVCFSFLNFKTEQNASFNF